ncbi:hypothetical protein EDB92DRAFT_2119889 [Lactarius akahatsu]|uniref:Fungal STAND N-terminal Goodbye domain-containing protein n=1 Tax=Lactarius akahatsu TaxID=416441 RepID=A0AAD4L4G5_9AGAM|nr:hypothetical protein EDB92DRAFT_2119889 [Lactarius akahatsu]
MSQSRAQTHPVLDLASITSSSNFQAIFCDSWKEYEQKTKKNLLVHPLTSRLQSCNSPTDILAVLYDQVPGFDPSRRTEDRFTKLLGPTVNVLYAFATTLNEGVGLVFSPAKVIFAGAGVLLLAAKDAVASREALIDMFEQIESFFKRLETYTEVPTTESMRDIIVKIMVEVLDILAISTKEIKQGRTKKYFRKLIGRTDIEDALKGLNKLTQEEARMAIAQVLKVTHHVDDGVKNVGDIVGLIGTKMNDVDDKVKVIIEGALST